ncbi:uncharacterized protein LOC131434353 [Malaya genurostris]|uniref:uncharacterized protein LOC131434353 n=1 Tax=Malaya genurostris TaxID=325434 RepID=UPI0026F3F8FE|nr:uncharacterized protein LOC131434353 [Malaya genurostris]
MVGPVVQQDLLSITIRFRFRRLAIVADVEKMYRMVKVQPNDQHLQRILWRDSPDETLRTYELTTVTYGTASAPYLATKCLQTLAKENEANNPRAARVLKDDFYVDDMLSGADNVEDGKQLIHEMIELTSSGGFTLRKWISNEPQLLEDLPKTLLDDRVTLELDKSSAPVKTLGLLWEPMTDRFVFRPPKWNDNSPITKRIVLADTARLFDPLGLIGPVIVQAKIFLQNLWKQKCEWDEPLAPEFQRFWLEHRRNLLALESLHIPRWTGFSSTLNKSEIHGFCDASEAAYGACLYLRSTNNDGSIIVRLITSKSRVAPIEDPGRKKKKQSIPRLELSSALLLSHLYEKLVHSMQISIPAYFWTDSMIVKCWLSSLPSRWQSFVANRVSEIQHITKKGVWNHISGIENPADIISRGMTPAQLQYQRLWFEGPQWISDDYCTWPKTSAALAEPDESLLEEKSSVSLPIRVKAPNLSTQAFLAAFRRFVAIRGKPQIMMCDNATNFVGANRELKELRQQLNDQQFQYSMIRAAEDDGIEFKFIPARSPNFGGLWEAAVKSFKGHFRRTIGINPLSYDQLHTVVQQVAAILNSRPLTPLSNDPHDYPALTPGHFLTGRPLTAIPEPELHEIPENRLELWQRSQVFVQRI